MITTEDVLNLNFYKKETFTGSYKGMRYRLKKEKNEEDTDIFLCHIWPGPYNFATTADEEKISASFPFSEAGKQEAVDWMNAQWALRKNWVNPL